MQRGRGKGCRIVYLDNPGVPHSSDGSSSGIPSDTPKMGPGGARALEDSQGLQDRMDGCIHSHKFTAS